MRALRKAGFVERKQTGSHVHLVHADDKTRRASVPMHGGGPVRPVTLSHILRGAGLTAEGFVALL